jgi:hypothetical protein
MAQIIKRDFSAVKNTKIESHTGNQPRPIYQLKLSLTFSDPPIWRRIQVPGNLTLADLHTIIQISMGWDDTDEHQFLVGKIFYKKYRNVQKNDSSSVPYDEACIELQELEESMRFIFTYIYDGGEGCECEITLEKIATESEAKFCPRLVAGEKSSTPATIYLANAYKAPPDTQVPGEESVAGDGAAGERLARQCESDTLDIASINKRLALHFHRT